MQIKRGGLSFIYYALPAMYMCAYTSFVTVPVDTTLSIHACRPATTLDTLQKKQKEIEEENQKKKAMLQQVLAERYRVCFMCIRFGYAP